MFEVYPARGGAGLGSMAGHLIRFLPKCSGVLKQDPVHYNSTCRPSRNQPT